MDEKGTQLPPTSSTSPVEEHERQVDSDDSDHAQAADDKQLLADVLENTADMVEIAVMSVKSTQVAYCCVVEALSQLSDMLDISCKVFESSQQLAARFMSQKGHDGYQELFLGHPELDVTYSALQRSLEEAEEAAFPHLMSRMKRSHAQDSLVCALSSHSEDEDEADNDKTSHHKQEDEADNDKTSHHKQVEKVCVEEHMGGAYLTQRRGSLRRSASADELSEERSDIQPNAQSPKCKSPTSKIVHHQQSKSSDSDVEEPPSPEP